MLTSTDDWYGLSSPFVPRMSLEIRNHRLIFRFSAEKAAYCDRDLALGRFQEGLWEKDVAEIFVAGPDPSYQEINVSPTGAWWSALFSNYREFQQEVRFEPTIAASISEQRWEIEFTASLDDLVPWRNVPPPQRLISSTAILHSPEPHYFAWNHTTGGEPDFHRRDLFQPLKLERSW